jgi:ATP-dependent Zn protease
LVRLASERTEQMLRDNLALLQPLASTLAERETLSYTDIEGILGPRPFPHTNPLTPRSSPDSQ